MGFRSKRTFNIRVSQRSSRTSWSIQLNFLQPVARTFSPSAINTSHFAFIFDNLSRSKYCIQSRLSDGYSRYLLSDFLVHQLCMITNGWPIKNEGLDIWLIYRSILIAHSRTHSWKMRNSILYKTERKELFQRIADKRYPGNTSTLGGGSLSNTLFHAHKFCSSANWGICEAALSNVSYVSMCTLSNRTQKKIVG